MMADREVVCLSSDSEADDTVRNEFTGGMKRSFRCSFHCTACGTEMFGVSEIHEHPWLHGVGICSDCFDFLHNSGPFTKDPLDGADEHCRWCGQGGTIIVCDNCEKSFCEDCIVRNYGKRGLTLILNNVDWSCFCCNPESLWVHVNRLKEFRNSVSSERNFSPRTKDTRTSITRKASRNASDVKRGNKCQTLAELLTLNKEQNQGKGIQTRVATPCTKERHPPEAKQHTEGIEKPQQAQAVPPPRTFIRPHQMIEKHREAAERRTRMAAERLKSSVTNGTKQHDSNFRSCLVPSGDTALRENYGTQQHDSIANLQAKPEIHEAGPEPTRFPLLARDYYRPLSRLV